MADNTITLVLGGAVDLILQPPAPDITPIVTVHYQGFSATARGDHMAYTLPIDKFIKVLVAYVDKNGNPAIIDGDVMWLSSNEANVAIVVDPTDSSICTITPQGPIGTAQISATADADLGTGVREIVTLLDITTVAGEAVAGTINVIGDPQPIPARTKK